jgi:hypothetical protein
VRPVVLVPWRGGDFRREKSWAIVRSYLEQYDWPIYTGDSPGAWSRAQAVNAAADAAGDWDVALINDGDTVGQRHVIVEAAVKALDTKGGIRPHNRLWMLSSEQSSDFASFGPEGTIVNIKTKLNPGGGLMVVSRAAWDAVGGYDDAFQEWGHEDSHFNTRLLALAYWDMIEGTAWHLWHERDTTKTPNVIANRQRMREVQSQYEPIITEESNKRGWNVAAYL